jgi:hypothetical protein
MAFWSGVRILLSALAVVAVFGARPAAAERAIDSTTLLTRIERIADGPGHAALEAAIEGYARALSQGLVSNTSLLTVIDYSRPSNVPRLWVFDLAAGRLLYRELVAHGRNSGDNVATEFSNDEGSLKSSLGLFVTGQTYYGENGYSLRLQGLDPGINDNAMMRSIVMHGAAYVSQQVVQQLGRLGRSWGCPALRSEIARTVIDRVKGGSVIYAYGRQPSTTTSLE